MFARSTCPRCSRSLAMNGDGQLRFHYCPHHTHCGLEACAECAASREDRHVRADARQRHAEGSPVEVEATG
jgi:hypothetical protein